MTISRRSLVTGGAAAAGTMIAQGGWAAVPAMGRRAGGAPAALSATLRHLDALGAWVETEVAAGRVIGTAISVARHGAIVWEKGFGWADVAQAKPACATTPFSLASVTKPFTTAAIAALAQQGRLHLDDPINRYLVAPLPRSAFDDDAITIRQLGGHAGGLPTFFAMFGEHDRGLAFGELISGFGRMAYPAGERYEYSNIGYALLGQAASRVTGLSYARVLEDQVIRPMGLKNTLLVGAGDNVAKVATRYDQSGSAIPFYHTATPPSGELYASVHDLSMFAAHMMGVASQPPPVFSRTTLNEIFSPVVEGTNGTFTSFGWSGTDIGGARVIMKDGGQPGVSAMLTLIPALGLSIAVAANRMDNRGFVETATTGIASAFLPEWSAPHPEPLDPIPTRHALAWYDGLWTGTLSNDGASEHLRLEMGAVRSRLFIGRHGPLPLEGLASAQGALQFRCPGSLPFAARSASGDHSLAFKLVARGERLAGRCLELAISSSLASLTPYIVELDRS